MSDNREIDLRKVVRKLKEKRRVFFITMPLVFVLSCIYIFSLPRFYSTDLMLAPEMDNSMAGGALGSIASTFGFDLSSMQTTDAITPLLYPDLMEDNGFVSRLFDIKVKTKDGAVDTTYYCYLRKYQKKPWWNGIVAPIKKLMAPKDNTGVPTGKGVKRDPYRLNLADDMVAEAIRGNITLNTDKKTGVITIKVKDQDPVICRMLADSVKMRLQHFITDYRTNKARTDVKYYTELANEALHEYEAARRRYGGFADANMDVVLESYRAKQEDLENDMQLKYNTYSTINAQLQAAKAKVQERTPAFTLVKGAAVPVKPAGPKRVIFVLGMMFLSFFLLSFYLARRELHFTF